MLFLSSASCAKLELARLFMMIMTDYTNKKRIYKINMLKQIELSGRREIADGASCTHMIAGTWSAEAASCMRLR